MSIERRNILKENMSMDFVNTYNRGRNFIMIVPDPKYFAKEVPFQLNAPA
jgi:hypothetical protein